MNKSEEIRYIQLMLQLFRAVGRLAMPPEAQVSFLQSIISSDLADELALDFDDGVHLLPMFLKAGWMNQSEADILLEINRLLDEMSPGDYPELWYSHGLYNDSRWVEVRRLAREFLAADQLTVRITSR